jgi:hypothetical protein
MKIAETFAQFVTPTEFHDMDKGVIDATENRGRQVWFSIK